jgi:hypothetical protein
MRGLIGIGRALLGLFVEDEFLAAGTLAIVVIAALLLHAFGVQPRLAGTFLLVGNIVVLVVGAVRAGRRKHQRLAPR